MTKNNNKQTSNTHKVLPKGRDTTRVQYSLLHVTLQQKGAPPHTSTIAGVTDRGKGKVDMLTVCA